MLLAHAAHVHALAQLGLSPVPFPFHYGCCRACSTPCVGGDGTQLTMDMTSWSHAVPLPGTPSLPGHTMSCLSPGAGFSGDDVIICIGSLPRGWPPTPRGANPIAWAGCRVVQWGGFHHSRDLLQGPFLL